MPVNYMWRGKGLITDKSSHLPLQKPRWLPVAYRIKSGLQKACEAFQLLVIHSFMHSVSQARVLNFLSAASPTARNCGLHVLPSTASQTP